MPFSVLVTGANRGIGLALTRQLIVGPDKADHVFAACRNMDECKELRDIQKENKNLHIVQLDVLDETSYPRVVKEVADVVQGSGLNLLINNAGMGIRTNLADLKSDDMVKVYKVNCVAPLMLAKAFLPLLRAAVAAPGYPGDAMSYRRAAVLNISSRMASIDDNGMGGFYEYRASKAALNAVTRSLGIDLRPEHILAISMDPGWVRTRMGSDAGKISPEESASSILAAMAKMSNENTSTYVDRFGKAIPW